MLHRKPSERPSLSDRGNTLCTPTRTVSSRATPLLLGRVITHDGQGQESPEQAHGAAHQVQDPEKGTRDPWLLRVRVRERVLETLFPVCALRVCAHVCKCACETASFCAFLYFRCSCAVHPGTRRESNAASLLARLVPPIVQVREHHRKLRKEQKDKIKAGGGSLEYRKKKDPGIPNTWCPTHTHTRARTHSRASTQRHGIPNSWCLTHADKHTDRQTQTHTKAQKDTQKGPGIPNSWCPAHTHTRTHAHTHAHRDASACVRTRRHKGATGQRVLRACVRACVHR